jgi:hypothetical protein
LSGITGLGFHLEIRPNKMADGNSTMPPGRNMTHSERAIIVGTGNQPSKTFV